MSFRTTFFPRDERVESATAFAATESWLDSFFVRALLFGLTLGGCVLRFARLDAAPAFVDETHTLLRVAGHSYRDIELRLLSGGLPLADLRAFFVVDASSSLAGTMTSLAREDAQHPPAFFLLARAAAAVLGSSIASARLVGACAGVGAVVLSAVVARRLFGPRATWVAAALAALSPSQFLYAREARTTSLLPFGILLATWLYDRAAEKPTARRWTAYALGASAGLYMHLLVAPVIIAHGAHLALDRDRRRSLLRWVAALASIAVIFSPWLWILYRASARVAETTAWMTATSTPQTVASAWAANIGRSFVDHSFASTIDSAHVTSAVALLVSSAALVVLRAKHSKHRSAASLLLSIAFVSALLLIVPDVLFGGVRSTVNRYEIPVFLAAELLVVGAISVPVRGAAVALPAVALAVCAFLGASSIVKMVPATHWWTRYCGDDVERLARRLDHEPGAVVRVRPADLPHLAAIALAAPEANGWVTFSSSHHLLPPTLTLRIDSSASSCKAAFE